MRKQEGGAGPNGIGSTGPHGLNLRLSEGPPAPSVHPTASPLAPPSLHLRDRPIPHPTSRIQMPPVPPQQATTLVLCICYLCSPCLPPHPFRLLPDPPFLPQSCPVPAISVRSTKLICSLSCSEPSMAPQYPQEKSGDPHTARGGLCVSAQFTTAHYLSTGQSYMTFPFLANPDSFPCTDWPLAWFNALLPLKQLF